MIGVVVAMGRGVSLPGYVTACDEFTCFGVWPEMTEESGLSEARRKLGGTRWAVGFKTRRSDILDLGWIYFCSIQPVLFLEYIRSQPEVFGNRSVSLIMRGLSAAILLLSILKGNGRSFWPHFGFLSHYKMAYLVCVVYNMNVGFWVWNLWQKLIKLRGYRSHDIIVYFAQSWLSLISIFFEGPNTSPTVGQPDLLWILFRFHQKKKMPSKFFPPHVFIYTLS